MRTRGKYKQIRQLVAVCGVVFYLALTLAGSWHQHHTAAGLGGAICPGLHEHHCCGDHHQPPIRIAGNPAMGEADQCQLCKWAATARLGQERFTLDPGPLEPGKSCHRGITPLYSPAGYPASQSRAPPTFA